MSASLDSPDFAVEALLNEVFPDEASLATLDSYAEQIQARLVEADEQTRLAVRKRALNRNKVASDLKEARNSVALLEERIAAVVLKAEETERVVASIGRDIKRLDFAKKNLSSSITALKRYHMLSVAVEQLEFSVEAKRYDEAGNLLNAISELSAFFEPHREKVERIRAALSRIDRAKDALTKMVFEDVRAIDRFDLEDGRALDDGVCAVADSLGVASGVRTALVDLLLSPYDELFESEGEPLGLSSLERRFSWLKRVLKSAEKWSEIPKEWGVHGAVVSEFVFKTQNALDSRILNADDYAVSEMMVGLRRTKEFEAEFLNFSSDLSDSFSPYLHKYVALEETTLKNDVLELFNREEEVDDENTVFRSATGLFLGIKNALHRCEEVSLEQTYTDLIAAVSRVLRWYADEKLKERGASTASLKLIAKTIRSAEYCADTVQQLESAVSSKTRVEVDLEATSDAFLDSLASLIQRAVDVAVSSLDLAPISNTRWDSFETPGDESRYAKTAKSKLVQSVSTMEKETPKVYLKSFEDKLKQSVASTIYAEVLKNKKISTAGAQQLLVDVTSLVDASGPSSAPSKFKEMELVLKMCSLQVNDDSELPSNFKLFDSANNQVAFEHVLNLRGVVKRPTLS